MVDTQDLKSCDHNGCAGSSPAPGTAPSDFARRSPASSDEVWSLGVGGLSHSNIKNDKRSKLTSCFILRHSETHTNSKDESYGFFEEKGCNFFFEDNEFFCRVATRDLLLYLLNWIWKEYLPDLSQLILGRFYKITDIRSVHEDNDCGKEPRT